MVKEQPSQVHNINFGFQSTKIEAIKLFAFYTIGSHENIILNV